MTNYIGSARIGALSSAVVLLLFFVPNDSFAQSVVIEEVVVTAQKREENLQDVPITVNAYSGEQLQALGVNNARDLALFTPSLAFQKTSSNFTAPSIYLRGLGNESFHANASSPVGVYVDGTYLGSTTLFGFQVMDVERVEVLKGPQGTLFGRNTTAGLLNYVTKKPSTNDGFGGNISATVGNFGSFNIQAAANLPLSENAALRIAAKTDSTDGQFENRGTTFVADEYGGYDAESFRATLLWDVSDELSIMVSGFVGDLDGDAAAGASIGALEPPGGPFAPSCTTQPTIGTTSCVDALGSTGPGDFFTSSDGFPGFEISESVGGSFELNYSLSTFDVKWKTSYADTERQLYTDSDHRAGDFLSTSQETIFDSISHEFLLTSTESSIDWVAGAYYYTDELRQWESSALLFVDNLFGGNGVAGEIFDQETETVALFGQADFNLTDNLTLTAGLRWTSDDRSSVYERFTIDPAVGQVEQFRTIDLGLANRTTTLIPSTPLGDSWDELSGRLSLAYFFSDSGQVYGSFARGFKGGEIASSVNTASEYVLASPEFIDAFEVGLKTDLWDGVARLNAAVFDYDFTDQQVFVESSTSDGAVQLLTNAGTSSITGAEVEFFVNPGERLSLRLTAAYLKAEFDEFIGDPNDLDGDGDIADLSGNSLPNAPEVFFSAFAQYAVPLSSGGTIFLQGDAVFQDQRFFTAANNPTLSQDSYWLTGARLTYESPESDWTASLWGKNLSDEEYIVGGFDFTASVIGGIYPVAAGEGRTFGITFAYEF